MSALRETRLIRVALIMILFIPMLTLQSLADTFPLWCVPQPVYFNRIDDPTRPFLSFLNVRRILLPDSRTPPPGWPILDHGDGLQLVENPSALPRAFAPRRYRGERNAARRIALLASITDFGQEGVLDADTGSAWVENGRAEATVEAYAADRLTLRVVSREGAFVGTSLVNWPGWTVAVDGKRVDLVGFNHAFVGFRAPGGAHRVVLRYLPIGVRRGAAISAVSAVLALALVLRRARRGAAPASQPGSGSATTTA